jgi:hypothetical protein
MFRATTVAAVLAMGLMAAMATAANPPFGGDDTGFIPVPKSDTAKCEAKASKAASKLISCIIKCHDSRASGKITSEADEETCESGLSNPKPSCTAAFAASIAKLKSCPTCISGTTMATLANTIETLVDANNGSVYCATSPSGAFLQ